MRYKTVIFDMDGTLLNTLEDIADGVNHTLKEYGYPQRTLEEVRCAVGNGARFLMRRMLPDGEENPKFEQILKVYEEYYKEHCQIKTGAYPGIRKLLEDLKQKSVGMAIVSNKGDGAVKELNRIYFSDSIAAAVGERPGIRRKPEADSVLEALRLLRGERKTALYVGDSEVDAATAANAGMDCALVSWGFRPRQQLQELGAAYLIDRPEELLEIISGCL